jgi:hypothetical protein
LLSCAACVAAVADYVRFIGRSFAECAAELTVFRYSADAGRVGAFFDGIICHLNDLLALCRRTDCQGASKHQACADTIAQFGPEGRCTPLTRLPVFAALPSGVSAIGSRVGSAAEVTLVLAVEAGTALSLQPAHARQATTTITDSSLIILCPQRLRPLAIGDLFRQRAR